ncbi:hydrogen gas-evolving membrane-bound hydrogenase subunit E [Roseivivax halodurans]|nr:hydrogen gas-evolving membrane-bound hydrogenase subunit E [Roseivivax halodurans]
MIAFDLALAAGILLCAVSALTRRDRTASVAAFMVLGLLVALSWVRLAAPDVALAEAAIGAGLTGALFLRAARRLGPLRPAAGRTLAVPAALVASGLGGGLAWVFASASPPAIYAPLVAASLPESGVSNPVTAVLLNFRAWDTLLEIAVLVVALLVANLLGSRRLVPVSLGEMTLPFARIVAPISILLAGHLLWQGSSAPGGAFQAGAVLAGGLLALVLAGLAPTGTLVVRGALIAGLSGLAVFLIAALGSEALTGSLLGYPNRAEKVWIVAIEAALTLSIAATLCLLFTGFEKRKTS